MATPQIADRWWKCGLFGALFALAPPIGAEAGEPISVFVSILPQKYFVKRIGGNRVEVTAMVGPGQTPATYSPSPSQMDQLEQAHVHFRIGVPFEEAWMDRLRTLNPKMEVVDTRVGSPLRTLSGLFGASAREDNTKRRDPHIWTNPVVAQGIATHIRDTLVAVDPEHRAQYQTRYREFIRELAQLDATIQSALAGLKGCKVMAYHPSWGYFLDRYGLEQVPIELVGKPPGPKQLAAQIDYAQETGIRVILVQKQFDTRAARIVAREVGATVLAVDPLAEDYISNLEAVATKLATVLGNGRVSH